jgi:hypothetical protein
MPEKFPSGLNHLSSDLRRQKLICSGSCVWWACRWWQNCRWHHAKCSSSSATTVKFQMFWDLILCWVRTSWHFKSLYCLHLQRQHSKRRQPQTARPWRWKHHNSLKHCKLLVQWWGISINNWNLQQHCSKNLENTTTNKQVSLTPSKPSGHYMYHQFNI